MNVSRKNNLFRRVMMAIVLLPMAAVLYVAGSAIILIYSVGSVVVSAVSLIAAVAAVYSLFCHDWQSAITGAIAAAATCPYGIPLVTMGIGTSLVGAGTFLYQMVMED